MTNKVQNFLKKVRVSTLVYGALIVLVLVFAASLIAVYGVSHPNAFVDRLKSALPYPVAIVSYQSGITYRVLSQNMASVKRFYEAQDFGKIGLRVDFSTAEGQQRFKVREKEVLNKMIEDEAIKRLAKERGIWVSQDEAAQGVARKLEEYGSGEEVKKDLERLYGWTLADFEKKVVMPSLYQEKLQASFVKEVDVASKALEKIRLAQDALRAGQSFADAAKQFSEGRTAEDGGDLGWFVPEDLAPELRQSVTLQKVGVPGDVVESGLGFHILLVEEIKKEDSRQLYRLRQIFTRKTTFADFLSERMRGLSVLVLSPEYVWNVAEARVEFRKQELRNFEKNLFEKSDGDAAFFF
ncbi:MAG: peptidylprolyl isomerase [bacterium]|nr:peptidylprolyl isomerase [bacterium]